MGSGPYPSSMRGACNGGNVLCSVSGPWLGYCARNLQDVSIGESCTILQSHVDLQLSQNKTFH